MKVPADLFTSFGVLICAVMILVNLGQIKQKGNGALVRALSFALFAVLLLELKKSMPTYVEAITGVFIFILLAIDVILKARKSNGESQ